MHCTFLLSSRSAQLIAELPVPLSKRERCPVCLPVMGPTPHSGWYPWLHCLHQWPGDLHRVDQFYEFSASPDTVYTASAHHQGAPLAIFHLSSCLSSHRILLTASKSSFLTLYLHMKIYTMSYTMYVCTYICCSSHVHTHVYYGHNTYGMYVYQTMYIQAYTKTA